MLWIPALLSLGCGLYLVTCAWRERRAVQRARDWNRTPGAVIGWCPPSRDPRGEFHLVYEYRVGQRIFRSDRICAGGEERRGARAWARCRTYLERPRILVSYDPSDPHRACIEIGSDREAKVWAVGILCALIGIIALL
jgi:Protein of unknown function (DUF3592)